RCLQQFRLCQRSQHHQRVAGHPGDTAMTPPSLCHLQQPARILVVDDEPTNLKVLKQILQDDYRLLFAKSGDEAIALAGREQPDLILLDVMMPGMTGFETCRRLKTESDTARIPVIFVTALKDEVDETTGFAVGGVDYISKPVVP